MYAFNILYDNHEYKLECETIRRKSDLMRL